MSFLQPDTKIMIRVVCKFIFVFATYKDIYSRGKRGLTICAKRNETRNLCAVSIKFVVFFCCSVEQSCPDKIWYDHIQCLICPDMFWYSMILYTNFPYHTISGHIVLICPNQTWYDLIWLDKVIWTWYDLIYHDLVWYNQISV